MAGVVSDPEPSMSPGLFENCALASGSQPTRLPRGINVTILLRGHLDAPGFHCAEIVSRAPLSCPKEGPDASRENGHAPSARSAAVEVRWWRTDP
jgi:hypothetical protein